MRSAPLFVAYIASLLITSALADETPTGVILSLTGSTNPPMTAMAEIPAGAPLSIEPGAEVTFLHYGKCKLVTVSGGRLTVTRTDFSTDGKIVSENDGPCPHVHRVSSGSTAGLMIRGPEAPRWPLDRELFFLGDGTDQLKAASIYADGQLDAPLVQLDVSGHQATYPENAPPLTVGGRYVLRLTMADRAEPVDIPFVGLVPDGPTLLVVLR